MVLSALGPADALRDKKSGRDSISDSFILKLLAAQLSRFEELPSPLQLSAQWNISTGGTDYLVGVHLFSITDLDLEHLRQLSVEDTTAYLRDRIILPTILPNGF